MHPADPVQEMDGHPAKMNERLQRGTRGWMDGSGGIMGSAEDG